MIFEFIFNSLVIILLCFWHVHRLKVAEQLIRKWSIVNDLILLDFKFKLVNKGAFLWGSSGIDLVYKLIVKNTENEVKECWVRVGDVMIGMLFNKNIHEKWSPSHTDL